MAVAAMRASVSILGSEHTKLQLAERHHRHRHPVEEAAKRARDFRRKEDSGVEQPGTHRSASV